MQNSTPLTTLVCGDRAPVCFGMAADRTFYCSEAQYGRAALLLLCGAGAVALVGAVIQQLASCRETFAASGTDVLLIVDAAPVRLFGDAHGFAGLRVVECGRFLTDCGAGRDDLAIVLVDRNQRIVFAADARALSDIPAACLNALATLPREPATDIVAPAPVILLPNLLPPEVCQALITLHHDNPTADGGVAREGIDGRPIHVVDHDKKQRRDFLIPPGGRLHNGLGDLLVRRARPEIAKAFQADITHTDRLLVACYDENAGYFRRHRDNVPANVAFRQFALSINLNTGEYDGGQITFPEYNDHRYRAPSGAGVVFSTAVLHEVAPVTRGKRYVLLTFLHDDAAEARRLGYEQMAAAA